MMSFKKNESQTVDHKINIKEAPQENTPAPQPSASESV